MQSHDVVETYLIRIEYLQKVNHNANIQLFDKYNMHMLWSNNINHYIVILFILNTTLYTKIIDCRIRAI